MINIWYMIDNLTKGHDLWSFRFKINVSFVPKLILGDSVNEELFLEEYKNFVRKIFYLHILSLG